MSIPINNLNELLKSMEPVLNDGIYCFATLKDQDLPVAKIVASIWEREGLSVVVSEQTAIEYGLESAFKAAWITLNVHSDLAAIGLTAAFSTALGQAEISCNVVAGNFHDHIFVPYEKRDLALQTLLMLQQTAKNNEINHL